MDLALGGKSPDHGCTHCNLASGWIWLEHCLLQGLCRLGRDSEKCDRFQNHLHYISCPMLHSGLRDLSQIPPQRGQVHLSDYKFSAQHSQSDHQRKVWDTPTWGYRRVVSEKPSHLSMQFLWSVPCKWKFSVEKWWRMASVNKASNETMRYIWVIHFSWTGDILWLYFTFIWTAHLNGQTVIAGKMFPSSEVSVECSRVVPPFLNWICNGQNIAWF